MARALFIKNNSASTQKLNIAKKQRKQNKKRQQQNEKIKNKKKIKTDRIKAMKKVVIANKLLSMNIRLLVRKTEYS